MPVAEEGVRGAEQAVIVQGLYDRNSFLICRIVGSRRDHRESVVDVDDLRPLPLHQRAKLAVGLPVPNCVAQQNQRVGASHLIVAGLVKQNLVAMRPQQLGLLGKDLILAARLLVRIVHGENLHPEALPWPRYSLLSAWCQERLTLVWAFGNYPKEARIKRSACPGWRA